MTKILGNILITILISTIGSIGAYKYAPMSWFETEQAPKFGTTITTINGSDTLSNSRTTINDNFTALNNGKIEVGTTSVNSITALNNLATVGTITSGTWTGSVIDVARQGTGTTSPTSNQVIIGNGASGFKVVGFGSSGQFLTSGGNGVAPSWTTGGIDQTLDYNFTGSAFRVKSLIASTTISFSNGGAGISYVFPSSLGASSTVLKTNASGTLIWGGVSQLLATGTPLSYTTSSATSSIASLTIPGGMLGTNNIIKVRVYLSGNGITLSTNNFAVLELAYGYATSTMIFNNTGVDSGMCGPPVIRGWIEFQLSNAGQTGSQMVFSDYGCNSDFSSTWTSSHTDASISKTISVDSTQDKLLTFNFRLTNSGGNDRVNFDRTIIELIAK